ncbi:MAG TPA: DUF308 domain-containing protein [Ktedonobacteraceae bacterium]|jgi:uncharacterized membrane protein HdeD (DUF308 family)
MAKLQTFSGSVAQKLGPRWKILLIEGVCAIIFGILAIAWPGLTFLVFLYIFGIYAVFEGLVLTISALYLRKTPMAWENETTPAMPGSWMILLVEGLLSILAGLLCIFIPHYSAQGLLYVIALWALFIGIASLVHARTRGWRAALVGVLAIIVSFFLFFRSISSAQTIFWLIGICAILAGALLIWQGLVEKHILNMPLEPA